eukprot:TRINITY_DN4882_c0_g1_i5.p1 TRINITY_DN4882_c0_g1~~TRINITY_DN4882_c0_g1_i5.p1  ORF type:complete len:1532 (+),score=313.57 TRINITY_DN4882_c0_g1_i5:124-4719(+)
MSDILSRWLNDEVVLSSKVDSRQIEVDFSNGYLFGELLHRFMLITDFELYANRSTPESKVLNFSRLEVSLTEALGIVLSSKMASDIMAEKKGAAGKLLLQIKLALENLAKARAALRDSTRLNALWSAKVTHKPQSNDKFAESLRQKTPRFYDISSSARLKKFTDEGERNKQLSARLQNEDEENKHKKYSAKRKDQIERLQENQRSAREWDNQNAQIHSQVQQARMEREKYERTLTAAHKERVKLKKEKEKENVAREMERSIQTFEKALRGSSENGSDSDSSDMDITSPVSKSREVPLVGTDTQTDTAVYTSAYEHIEELKKKVPHPTDMKQESDAFIQLLRERKQGEDQNRTEREKRRRKVMLDQMKTHSDNEARRDKQFLLSKLLKQSDGEKTLGNRLLYIRREKEVVRKNRVHREKQYAEQRCKDILLALERDRLIAQRNEADYFLQIDTEKGRLKEGESFRRKQSYEKHYDFCSGIVSDIVELSYKIGSHREAHDGILSHKLIFDWMSFFLRQLPLNDVPSASELEILEEIELDAYLHNLGEWSLSEPEIPNHVLSRTVQDVFDMIVPPPKSPEPPRIPSFSFRGCIIGKPYSGKSVQALQLSQKFSLQVLVPEILLQESIAAFEMEEKDSVSKTRSDRSKLGEAALSLLTNGEPVSDEIMVALIINAIQQLGADKTCPGWILDGFPRTYHQAQLLERYLTGYEVNPVEQPFKLVDDGTTHKHVVRKSKILGQSVSSSANIRTAPHSGLDIAIRLDLSDDIVIRRAVGRRIDPATDVVYHVEYGPPPQDETINGRLVEVIDDNNSEMQLQHLLAGFQSEEALLLDWFSSFRILQTADASMTIEGVNNLLKTKVDAIIKRNSEDTLSGRGSNDPKSERLDSSIRGADADYIDAVRLEITSPESTITETMPNAATVMDDSGIDTPLAHILYEVWTQMEENYIKGLKGVSRSIRKCRDAVFRQLTKVKKEFQDFLKRPDIKQDYVMNVQKDFNAFDDDIRGDIETKHELHLRVSELRDILIDICNKRKEETEEEKKSIIASGWVEDFMRVFSHYFVLMMQHEVDRYQTTRQVLADYYTSKCKKPIDEAIYCPPFDITDGEYKPIKRVVKEKEPKKGANQKTDSKKAAPSERPPSPKESKPSKKKPAPSSSGNRAEKGVKGLGDTLTHLTEIANNALSIIAGVASEGFFGPDSPPELLEALDKEDNILNQRIQKISQRANGLLDEIRVLAETAFAKLDEWANVRYASEVRAVETVIFVFRQYIEEEQRLSFGLILEGEDVIIDEADLICDRPSTPPQPPRRDDPHPEKFNVDQLLGLSDHLLLMAPRGVIRTADFVTFLCRVAGTSYGYEMLPEDWCSFDREQYQVMASILDPFNTGYLDWRELVMTLSLPMVPNVSELISMKLAYQGANASGSGTISENEFMKLPLWFEGLGEAKHSQSSKDEKLKNLYFKILRDQDEEGYTVVDYVKFLLFLAPSHDAYEGLERACLIVSEDNVGGLVTEDLYKVCIFVVVRYIFFYSFIANHSINCMSL